MTDIDQQEARAAIGDVLERLIGLLDRLDGDAELEADGDEEDGSLAEDDEAARFANMGAGPGCEVSDPDLEHDGREQDDGH